MYHICKVFVEFCVCECVWEGGVVEGVVWWGGGRERSILKEMLNMPYELHPIKNTKVHCNSNSYTVKMVL